MSSSTVITLLPFEGPPKPQSIESVDALLSTVSDRLRERSVAAHKERIDLSALHAHTGQHFTQHVLIPDQLHATLRALDGVVPIVLLPPAAAQGATVAGMDAVILFADAHGALKGLPPNKVGTMLLNACGLAARAPLCGDCFFARMRLDGSGEPILGGEAAPQMVSERDWLEAAQAAHNAGVVPTSLEMLLVKRFAEARRSTILSTVTQAAEPSAQVSKKPTEGSVGGELPSAPPPSPPAGSAATPAAEAEPNSAATEGAAGEVLNWLDGDKASGTEKTLTVSVRVPPGTRAKHIRVTFKDQWLKVEVTTLEAAARVPVDGMLFQEILPSDCTWCVEDGPAGSGGERLLTISLEKKVAMRWLMLTRND